MMFAPGMCLFVQGHLALFLLLCSALGARRFVIHASATATSCGHMMTPSDKAPGSP
jgi:hypothetical protein